MFKISLDQTVRQGIEALPGGITYKARRLVALMDKETREEVASFSKQFMGHDITHRVSVNVVKSVLSRTRMHQVEIVSAIEAAFLKLQDNVDDYIPEPQEDLLETWYWELHGQLPEEPLDFATEHAWWKEQRNKLAGELDKRAAFGDLLADNDRAGRVYDQAAQEMLTAMVQELAKLTGVDLEEANDFFNDQERIPMRARKRWEEIKKQFNIPEHYEEANSRQKQTAFDLFYNAGMFDLEYESQYKGDLS